MVNTIYLIFFLCLLLPFYKAHEAGRYQSSHGGGHQGNLVDKFGLGTPPSTHEKGWGEVFLKVAKFANETLKATGVA